MFKLIIAGGREERFKEADTLALAKLILSLGGKKKVEIVTGGARGIDTEAYLWAKDNGYKVSPIFHAEWKLIIGIPEHCVEVGQYGKYNKCAGHQRNERMGQYGNGVVLFPGGKGTADMKRVAEHYKLQIWDWRDRKYGA